MSRENVENVSPQIELWFWFGGIFIRPVLSLVENFPAC